MLLLCPHALEPLFARALAPCAAQVDMADDDALRTLETDGEAKEHALTQLEQLQAQLAAHIKALKAPGGVPEMP